MGINAPLSEGHNIFGERQPHSLNPFSRDFPKPGKGRFYLPEGHSANAKPLEVSVENTAQAKEAAPSGEKIEDRGRSQLEIDLERYLPDENDGWGFSGGAGI